MLTTTPLRGNETWFFVDHSARHVAPINRQRGQSERVKGHSVQQREDFTPQCHEQHPRQPDDVPPDTRYHIAFAGCFGGRFIHLIVKRILNITQVKITKKAIHGCSAMQENLVFCWTQKSNLWHPLMKCFWWIHFPLISHFLHFPGCYTTAHQNGCNIFWCWSNWLFAQPPSQTAS